MTKDKWEVLYTNKSRKGATTLPIKVKIQLDALVKELEELGPYRNNWSHYGPLKKGKDVPENCFHCHISGGRPTYVVCWQIENKKLKIIGIIYVGTHENAPY